MFIILKRQDFNELMKALDNLTAAISTLTAAVDAVTASPATGATEAEVQAAADAVNAQAARLAPPAPAPVVTT